MARTRMLPMFAILVLSLALTCAIPSAYASPVWYAAGGHGLWDSGSLIYSYGSRVETLMYAAQSPQDDEWVNSSYARQNDGDFFEAGWYWNDGGTQRIWFSHLMKDGLHYPDANFTVSDAPTGTRASVIVRRRVGTTDRYDVYVNEAFKISWTNTGISSSIPSVAAERYDSLDYNLGSWKYVKHYRKISDTVYEWQYWPNAWASTFYNQDPTYRFWANLIDTSNHLVYVSNQLN